MTTQDQPQQFWAVMKAVAFSTMEVHGLPLRPPGDGPQRFIPLFESKAQAAAWALPGDTVALLQVVTPTLSSQEAKEDK